MYSLKRIVSKTKQFEFIVNIRLFYSQGKISFMVDVHNSRIRLYVCNIRTFIIKSIKQLISQRRLESL